MRIEKKCPLYSEESNNRTKKVFIYVEDLYGDGELYFNIDYDTVYSNQEKQHGNAFVELEEVLKAYQFNSFQDLADNLLTRYKGDDKAWKKIVEEMKAKGLDVIDDENESDAW